MILYFLNKNHKEMTVMSRITRKIIFISVSNNIVMIFLKLISTSCNFFDLIIITYSTRESFILNTGSGDRYDRK